MRHLVDYLDQVGSTDYFRGLVGEIRYQTQASRASEGVWNELDLYYTRPSSVKLPNKVYLSKLDVPTRNFTLGFPRLDGTLIKTPEGEDLVEYFSLQFRSELQLGASDEEGDYEIAFLADDGIRMEVGEGASRVTYLESPGLQATKMVCSTQVVSLRRDSTLPIRVSYFQGPRQHIALMMLWRKAGSERDSLCNKMGWKMYFNADTSPSTPLQPFHDLVARGWSVVPAHVFRIPRDEYMNPCESDRVRDVIREETEGCTALTCDATGL